MFFDYSKGLGLASIGAYITGKLSWKVGITLLTTLCLTVVLGIILIHREAVKKDGKEVANDA